MEAGGVVTGTDVALAGEGGDGDGVLQLRLRQVVADPSVHVTLKTQEGLLLDIFMSIGVIRYRTGLIKA